MATTRIWKGQDADVRKETDWHRVTAWGRLAEVVNQYMGKGKRVRVIGRLEYQSWTDKETGEQRMRAFVVASQVLFLDYDRAYAGLREEPLAEESATLEDAQPEAEAPSQPKRSRKQVA
jgi:single-strand DNA-binding protein